MGGAIAPGVHISTEALYQNASKLPGWFWTSSSAIGKRLLQACKRAFFMGMWGLADGMVARMRDELDFEMRVIATGGVARLIAGRPQSIEEVDILDAFWLASHQ